MPWPRKLWWAWLCCVQLYAIQYRDELLGRLILYAFVGLSSLSLTWAALSGGFHRGLGLAQLALWIPLQLYILFRLIGLDQQDVSNAALRAVMGLFVYSICQVATLFFACLLSFVDMVLWLRGARRVWGRSTLAGLSEGIGGGVGGPYSGVNSTDPSFSSDSHIAHSGDDPSLRAYGLASSQARFIGAAAAGSSSSSAYSLPSSPSLLGASVADHQDWTPRTHSEHLLNRAEREQKMLMQHQAKLLAQQQRQQQAPPPYQPSTMQPPTRQPVQQQR